jgi:hypothetical protein
MVRNIEDKDYKTLCEWWSVWNFVPPPQVLLPTTGFVASEAAAAFLYLSNSPVAWMEWAVVDPKATKQQRNESLNELLLHVEKAAKLVGVRMMFTSIRNAPFNARLKKQGWIDLDGGQPSYNLIRVL